MEEIRLEKLGLKSCRHNMVLLLGYSVDSHNVMSPPTGVGCSATGFCSMTECGECCSVRVRCRFLPWYRCVYWWSLVSSDIRTRYIIPCEVTCQGKRLYTLN